MYSIYSTVPQSLFSLSVSLSLSLSLLICTQFVNREVPVEKEAIFIVEKVPSIDVCFALGQGEG